VAKPACINAGAVCSGDAGDSYDPTKQQCPLFGELRDRDLLRPPAMLLGQRFRGPVKPRNDPIFDFKK